MSRLRLALAAPLAAAALALSAGCGTAPAGYEGGTFPQPLAKPAVTLTATDGTPYDVRARTAGTATLVFFGYTHCPDVCPTTMAETAAAVRALDPAVRARLRVLFVATDPTRDTPAAVHAWLSRFDDSFVGLTGSFPAVQAFARDLLVGLSPPETQPDGSVQVAHGSQVVGFTPGGTAPVYWATGSGGTSLQAQLTHDLPLLVSGRQPSA